MTRRGSVPRRARCSAMPERDHPRAAADAPSPQSWWVLASRTETLSQILRRHAEELAAGPLAKLSLLIRDKQQLRKAFSEQWQQLSQEYTRVWGSQHGERGAWPGPTPLTASPPQTTQQEMEKLKAQYRSLARDSAQAKRKYQEASKGACQRGLGPPPRLSPSRCVPSRLSAAPGSSGMAGDMAQPGSGRSSGGTGRAQLGPWGTRQSSSGFRDLGHHTAGREHPSARGCETTPALDPCLAWDPPHPLPQPRQVPVLLAGCSGGCAAALGPVAQWQPVFSTASPPRQGAGQGEGEVCAQPLEALRPAQPVRAGRAGSCAPPPPPLPAAAAQPPPVPLQPAAGDGPHPVRTRLPHVPLPAPYPAACPSSRCLPLIPLPAPHPAACPVSCCLPRVLLPAPHPAACPSSRCPPRVLLPALCSSACPASHCLPLIPLPAPRPTAHPASRCPPHIPLPASRSAACPGHPKAPESRRCSLLPPESRQPQAPSLLGHPQQSR